MLDTEVHKQPWHVVPRNPMRRPRLQSISGCVSTDERPLNEAAGKHCLPAATSKVRLPFQSWHGVRQRCTRSVDQRLVSGWSEAWHTQLQAGTSIAATVSVSTDPSLRRTRPCALTCAMEPWYSGRPAPHATAAANRIQSPLHSVERNNLREQRVSKVV